MVTAHAAATAAAAKAKAKARFEAKAESKLKPKRVVLAPDRYMEIYKLANTLAEREVEYMEGVMDSNAAFFEKQQNSRHVLPLMPREVRLEAYRMERIDFHVRNMCDTTRRFGQEE